MKKYQQRNVIKNLKLVYLELNAPNLQFQFIDKNFVNVIFENGNISTYRYK